MTASGVSLLDRPRPPGVVLASPAQVCARLREWGIRACCLEDPALVNPSAGSPEIATVRQLLDAVVAENPSYRWDLAADGLINVFPSQSILDDQVDGLECESEGLWRVLDDRLRLRDHGMELFQELEDGDGPTISVSLPPGSLRDALNALVAPVEAAVWHISGSPGGWFLTVSSTA
jgi:hypothetical protein